MYCKKLQEAIERNNITALSDLKKTFGGFGGNCYIVDEEFITIHDLRMNPLAYALWVGRSKSFQHLHKKLGASIQVMENLFLQQGKTALEILCLNGSLEVVQYYLPIYLSTYAAPEDLGDISVSVDFQKSTLVETRLNHTYTPIHIACEHGNINIIDYIYKYFKNTSPLSILDVNFQDENSGENCALIACRKGNYPMVKFLHEVCDANFKALNKRFENAILVAAAASKKRSSHNYFDVFVYLIEVVKLDITYMHEEVMLLLEDQNMIKFYEKKLQSLGINGQKNNIEKKYEIIRPNIPVSKEEKAIEELGDNFELRRYLEDEDIDDQTLSILSSIKHEDLSTPFMSTMTMPGRNN